MLINMDLKDMLEYVEKSLENVFKSPVVKSAWIINMDGAEKENLAHVSLIINNTQKGYNEEFRKVKKSLDSLKNDNKIRFHFNVYKITDYWDRLKSMDAKLYSEMRLSIILFDPSGFFAPLKVLLLEGKIPCTRESVQLVMKESPTKILKVHSDIKREIISSIYNLVIDAGQAPIVLAGYDPPIPRKLPNLLETLFVKKNMLDNKTVNVCSDIVTYYKDIEHKRITSISGDDLLVFLEASELFIKRMEKLMNRVSKKR